MAQLRNTLTVPYNIPELYFSDAKDLREIRPGSNPTGQGRQMQVGWVKIGDFRQITAAYLAIRGLSATAVPVVTS